MSTNDREIRLQLLMNLLHELNPVVTPEDAEIAARLSLRAGNGQLVGGDALLADKTLDALNEALASMIAYRKQDASDADPTVPAQAGLDEMAAELTEQPVLQAPVERIDPFLEAEFEEHCIPLDADYLVELASKNPKAAVALFDVVTDYVDGDL